MKKRKPFILLFLSLFLLLHPLSMAHAQTFPDIQQSWAKNDIIYLSDKGIVSGYTDGTFKPGLTLNRETFGSFIGKTISIPDGYTNVQPFTDLSSWAKGVLTGLYEEKIMVGVTETTFGSLQNVTREQMSVIFVRLLGYEEKAAELNITPSFKDSKDISSWAKPYVAFANEIGFIGGMTDGTFKPKQTATRADASALVRRFHEHVYYYVDNAEWVIQKEETKKRGYGVIAERAINQYNQKQFIVELKGAPNTNAALTAREKEGTKQIQKTIPFADNGWAMALFDVSSFQDGSVEFAYQNGSNQLIHTIAKDTVVPLQLNVNGSIKNETDHYEITYLTDADNEINIFVYNEENKLTYNKSEKERIEEIINGKKQFLYTFVIPKSKLKGKTFTAYATAVDKGYQAIHSNGVKLP